MILRLLLCSFFFFFNDTATTEIYTLSLHDALPISSAEEHSHLPRTRRRWTCLLLCQRGLAQRRGGRGDFPLYLVLGKNRSEEHTSELQSHLNLVCRLLLEKKKNAHNP